jgi:hypothetical protein
MVEPESLNCATPRMICRIAGFLIAGLLVFFMGIHYTNDTWVFMPIDLHAYNVVKLVLSVIVLCYAVYAFRNLVLLEGLVILILGTSSLIYSITYLLYSEGGLPIIDMIFSISLMAVAAQTLRNRDWTISISLLAASIGFMLSGLELDGAIEGIPLLVSGTIMSSDAALQMMSAEISPNAVRYDPGHVLLTESVGIFILGITCLMVGIWYLDNVFSLWSAESDPYNIAKVVLSATVLAFSFYAVRGGEFATGMMMMLFGTSALSFSLSVLIFGNSTVELVDVVFGMVFFVSSVSAYFKGERVRAVAFFLVFFAVTFYSLFGGDALYCVIGFPFLVAAAIFVASSVKFSSHCRLGTIPE